MMMMTKLLSYITFPHVSTYKRRWVRRIVLVVAMPQAIVEAVISVFRCAAHWWRQP